MAAGDVSTALQDFGGAAADLFASKGARASAKSYRDAEAIALQNAIIAKESTNIKEIQESRQIFQTIGKQKAQVGGGGFSESGTALDLLRSSASQGALIKALTAEQGAITENSYAEQAGMFAGMANAAKSAATGSAIGGVLQAAGGVISLSRAFTTGTTTSTSTPGVATDAGITDLGTTADAGVATDVTAGAAADAVATEVAGSTIFDEVLADAAVAVAFA